MPTARLTRWFTVTYPPKITFGELRASGVRDVLIYCRDHRCSHHIAISTVLSRYDYGAFDKMLRG
jgi:hypothetical protein